MNITFKKIICEWIIALSISLFLPSMMFGHTLKSSSETMFIKPNINLTINFDNGEYIAYNASDAGSISGNAIGRRDAIARTHYLAAPFSGVTSSQIGVSTALFYNSCWKMYIKNFTTQGWTAVLNTTPAIPLGTDFSLAMPVVAPLILAGTHNHNHSSTEVVFSNETAAKSILIGNTYASALDWNDFSEWTKLNIADAIYYWKATNSTVSTYIAGAGTNGAAQCIPAMQSFILTTTGSCGSSSVSVDNSARINLKNPFYLRAVTDEIIRITLSGPTLNVWDDAVIRFNDMATTAFDFDWDAYKIVSRGEGPLVYTALGQEVYSINSVSNVDSLPAVDVVIYLPADGNYTLKIENSDPTIELILFDKKLGTYNVVSSSGYVFSGMTTDGENRFSLQLKSVLITGMNRANAATGLQINSSIKGFVIQTKKHNGSNAFIEVMDVTGKLIQVIGDQRLSEVSYIPFEMAEGAYMIKVTIDNTVFAQMIKLTR